MSLYNPYNNNLNGIYTNNRYTPQTNIQPTFQQPQFIAQTSNIQYANFEEASAYIIPPNSQMLFLDKSKDKCYLKTCDINGYSSIKEFVSNQKDNVEQQSSNEQNIDLSSYAKNEDLNNFLSKQDFENFKNELDNKLNDISRKINVNNAIETLNKVSV